MICPHCDYSSDRNDNLSRHINVEHGSRKMVSSLLDEILGTVVKSAQDEVGTADDEEQEHEESPYLRARDERVAEIQAEFRRQFPQFDKEVMELGVGRKERGKKRIRVPGSAVATRRSSRAARPGVPGENEPSAEEETEVFQDQIGSSGEVSVALGPNGLPDLGKYGCLPCELSFQDTNSLVKHVSLVHEPGVAGASASGSGEESGVLQDQIGGLGEDSVALAPNGLPDLGKHGCLPCGLSFRDSSNLKRHVGLVHEARQPVKCPRPWCQAEFSILAEMWKHKIGCMKVCPYPNCLKRFTRADRFAAHERGHLVMARRMAD